MQRRVNLNLSLSDAVQYYKDLAVEMEVEAEAARQRGLIRLMQDRIDDCMTARDMAAQFERQLAEKQSAERKAA